MGYGEVEKHKKQSGTRAPKSQEALTATTNSSSSASARRTADRSATGESRVQVARTPGMVKRKPALYNPKIGWETAKTVDHQAGTVHSLTGCQPTEVEIGD